MHLDSGESSDDELCSLLNSLLKVCIDEPPSETVLQCELLFSKLEPFGVASRSDGFHASLQFKNFHSRVLLVHGKTVGETTPDVRIVLTDNSTFWWFGESLI